MSASNKRILVCLLSVFTLFSLVPTLSDFEWRVSWKWGHDSYYFRINKRDYFLQWNSGRDVEKPSGIWVYELLGIRVKRSQLEYNGAENGLRRARGEDIPYRCRLVYVAYVPCVYFTILLSIYPAIFFIRTYRRRRVNRQALQPCGQCGYDLQGNESGTCPECGAATALSTKTEVEG